MEYEVFKYPVKKLPKVVRKKLGRYNAYAQYHSNGLIEIDPKFKGKKELILMIHEYLHSLNPNWEEDEIIEYSESIAAFLWKHEYRKIDNED